MFNLDKIMKPSTKELFLKMNGFKGMSKWVLVGGTALALHINHRFSEDLDFFATGNKIDNRMQKNIDDIIGFLRQNYSEVYMTQNEEVQRDYTVGGVKITFHITNSIDLNIPECKLIYKDGHINIASKEVLAAMKMHTILNHRIKSRDFYDIYYLHAKDGNSFASLLLNMKQYYPKYSASEKLIENRFSKSPLNSDDEGLESVVYDDITNFKQLRRYFNSVIGDIYKKDIQMLSSFSDDMSSKELEIFLSHRFGLGYTPALAYLSKTNEFEKLEKLASLDIKLCVSEKDLLQKSTLHYLVEAGRLELFKKMLRHSDSVPEDLKKHIGLYQNSDDKFFEALKYEKVVVRVSNILDDDVKISEIAKSKNLPVDKLIDDANEKRELRERKSIAPKEHLLSSVAISPAVEAMSGEELRAAADEIAARGERRRLEVVKW